MEANSVSGKVMFTPRADLHFTGAQSGRRYNLPAYVPIEINPSDIVHIDPKDLMLGVVGRPAPKPVMHSSIDTD
jgi:hypothetical protein